MGTKQFARTLNRSNDYPTHSKQFVFMDKRRGVRRFEIDAQADGTIPIEEAANLLATHCIARRQEPGEFAVMVACNEDLLIELTQRAKELMDSCSVDFAKVHLSQREQQVLIGVLQHYTNKEIAAKLFLSERTVKFHISNLLHKFKAPDRNTLRDKAIDSIPFERMDMLPPRPMLLDKRIM
jgi:DNA-binding NarL/FixJ family response regulator